MLDDGVSCEAPGAAGAGAFAFEASCDGLAVSAMTLLGCEANMDALSGCCVGTICGTGNEASSKRLPLSEVSDM